ncbi:cobalamin-binding protein [Amphritea sp. HPY]|uniref:cobalamin-binding protein n=1 Tax=Amphritea sp. HPY TaxID=3421652 RepID=UPI003D7C450A
MHYKYIFVKLFLFLLVTESALAEISVTDNRGRVLDLAQPAQRVVSLSPHITENLFAVGAGPQVVGVTSHSDYPAEALELPVIGNYESLNIEAIIALQPDLVIGWPDGNPRIQLERLEALGLPVYYSDPHLLKDIPANLRSFGILTGRSEGEALAQRFDFRLAELHRKYAGQASVRVFYQLWNKPLMTINHSQLIDQIISLCGGQNLFTGHAEPVPRLSVESVLSVDPEVILTGRKNIPQDWAEQWQQWHTLSAAKSDQFYQLNEDLLYRPTMRILDGAEAMCDTLQNVRESR